jgi:hypothetical protein
MNDGTTAQPSAPGSNTIAMLVGVASAMLTTFVAIRSEIANVVEGYVPTMERRVMHRVDSLTTVQFNAMLKVHQANLDSATQHVLNRIDSLRNDVAAMPPATLRPRITVKEDTAGTAQLHQRLDHLEQYQERILAELELAAIERHRNGAHNRKNL